MTADALVPPWLDPLLTAPFFTTCRAHGVSSARSERNMFCLDCPSASAFCFYCRSANHSDHRTIQIRRSSYHDVVRVAEIQRVLDIGGVQTYVINSARVLFLNERPQPKGSGGGGSGSSAAFPSSSVAGKGGSGGGPHICEICSRMLLDPFRFCSLGCKLEGIKRNGDASFIPEEEDGVRRREAAAAEAEVGSGGGDRTKRWRRRGRNTVPVTAAGGGGGGGGGGTEEPREGDRQGTSFQSPGTAGAPPLTSASTTTHSHRRRKGIPHRSPLASS